MGSAEAVVGLVLRVALLVGHVRMLIIGTGVPNEVARNLQGTVATVVGRSKRYGALLLVLGFVFC